MKYLDEFRNPKLAKALVQKIAQSTRKDVRLMMGGGMIAEVAVQTGLKDMLPKNVKLIPGPGCPRCTTSPSAIDRAVAISEFPKTIVTIHGGMMMIPGSSKSLEAKRAEGGDIRQVYSCPEALSMAIENPEKNVVFVALGYETTSPTIASALIEAQHKGIKNFYIINAHIAFTSVFRALLEEGEAKFDGLLMPGPVSTIIGSRAYEFIPERYKLPCVITGFEICDVLQSVHMLLRQIEEAHPHVETQYSRCVKEEGNLAAKKILDEVFEIGNVSIRGFGVIRDGGLKLRQKYEGFDAANVYDIKVEPKEPKGCICGEVLRGVSTPSDCSLFAKACTASRPVGPCMVDRQGICNFYYRSSSIKP